ncbi:uncharacterized protein LOC143214559 [Lasioglossum baleicum]|uniref:uncharacterized protein LOC143214559 n=1 Tax=Lasioglossum baleicum TaxID=434251 RepID=UPI003FCD667A
MGIANARPATLAIAIFSANSAKQLIALAIKVFHHTHHFVNQNLRKKDASIPHLPEQQNLLFYTYPVAMIMSVGFAIVWLSTDKLMRRPIIPLIGCFAGALLMLLIGIMEMKHADMYLNLADISDDELISHPVFIHNFIMCLLSLFCMNIYLIQAWILFDYCRWIKEYNISDASNDLPTTDSSANTDRNEVVESRANISKRESKMKEEPGDLDPIPQLDKFPSLTSISQSISIAVEDEPVIFYCCFVDLYNYIKYQELVRNPLHEFRVVHVM